MRLASRSWWWGAAATAVLSALPAPSRALTFSSSCERFEIDGNTFGAPDGTIDFADEFDNGTLAPEWSLLLGSANETGGAVIVHDPGAQIQLGPTLFEISTIENAAHGIENGAGNFTAASYWAPTLPDTDSEFHLQLYSISPIIEAAGMTVNNFSPQVATQQGNGSLPGYSVSQSLTHGVGASFTTVQLNSVPVEPAAVTGRIVLRIALDDATDTLTCAFSLDGGATFLSPFPPLHVFNGGVTDYDILLGAAGLTPNGPPPPPPPPLVETVPMQLFEVKNPDGPAARRVLYEVKRPSYSGSPYGNFGTPGSRGATLNVKLDGATQCFRMPAGAAWRRQPNGSGYTYTDPAGANGPVKMAFIRKASNGVLKSKAIIVGRLGPVVVVPPAVRGDLRLHLGGGSDYCGSTAGGTVVGSNAKRFRVRKAPAPASCGVPACSPSGAFVDEPDR